MRFSLQDVQNPSDSLRALAALAQRGILDPAVRRAARQITAQCPGRDDQCELEAIYLAVKHGTPAVPGLENGLRYVADARIADQFAGPASTLEECIHGACAEDCDTHACLVAALAAALGFRAGLRTWTPPGGDEPVHVYAVAYLPKRDPRRVVGMDTTVDEAYVGWEPPNGTVTTADISEPTP